MFKDNFVSHLASNAERDLNEFLAHEIRNPLSSALIAQSFVKSTVGEAGVIEDATVRESVLADHKIIGSSLNLKQYNLDNSCNRMVNASS